MGVFFIDWCWVFFLSLKNLRLLNIFLARIVSFFICSTPHVYIYRNFGECIFFSTLFVLKWLSDTFALTNQKKKKDLRVLFETNDCLKSVRNTCGTEHCLAG